MSWKELKIRIDEENNNILENPPKDVLAVFKYEINKKEGGTGGLMMGTWFEGATASRYVGAYYVYNVIKIASNPEITVSEIKKLINICLPKAVATAGLCGMQLLQEFCNEAITYINEMTDRDEILSLLNSLYLYGSNMNAWIHHYMKWGISLGFSIPTKADLLEMSTFAKDSYI